MTKKDICKLICENILDEKKAQPEYMKLVEVLHNDAFPEEAEAVKKLIVSDEKKHEDYLNVLSLSHECKCPGVVHVATKRR